MADREWGLYSDEGLVEGGFPSPEAAGQALMERYSVEDDLVVRQVSDDDE